MVCRHSDNYSIIFRFKYSTFGIYSLVYSFIYLFNFFFIIYCVLGTILNTEDTTVNTSPHLISLCDGIYISEAVESYSLLYNLF